MELRHLRAFLALAKERNFTRASQELDLSQPALSQQIKQLEQDVGAELVIRDPTGPLRLTTSGEYLRSRAQRILNDVDEVRQTIADPEGSRQLAPLRIGHSRGFREIVLASVLALLRDTPEMGLVVEEATSGRIEKRIREGMLDVGIVHGEPSGRDIAHEELIQAPLELIVNARHAFARRERITRLKELADERFILTKTGLRSRHMIDGYFAAKDFTPKIAIEANAVETILALVRQLRSGLTVLALPKHDLFNLTGLAVVQMPEPPVDKMYLVWRAPQSSSGAAETFRSAVRERLGLPTTDSDISPKRAKESKKRRRRV